MNKRHFLAGSLVALLACSGMLTSCNDDEDTVETKLYLTGTLYLGSYPYFLEGGKSVTYHPSGVTHPDGNALGLFYKITDVMSVSDTVYDATVNPLPEKGASFTATYPDSLATYTTSVTVYPIDNDTYYTTYTYSYITVVDSLLSCPLVNFDPQEMRLVDERDQHRYNYVILGQARWMAKNLYWEGCGRAYYDSRDVRSIFGGYYTWDEAIKACPSGWSLPSDEDWMNLARSINPSGDFQTGEVFHGIAGDLMVDAYFNGEKMWEFWPKVKITNSTGMKVIPCGFGSNDNGSFEGVPDYACFWTSTTSQTDTTQALYRYIYAKENDLKVGSGDKASAMMSVRCIKK